MPESGFHRFQKAGYAFLLSVSPDLPAIKILEKFSSIVLRPNFLNISLSSEIVVPGIGMSTFIGIESAPLQS